MTVVHAAPVPGEPMPCCHRQYTDGTPIAFNDAMVTCPGQVRAHHAPAALQPDVDLAAVRSPGGEPWANTDRIFARRSGGAPERRAVLEQQIREQERDDAARRVEAWAATLSDVHEAQIAAAAAEVIRGRR